MHYKKSTMNKSERKSRQKQGQINSKQVYQRVGWSKIQTRVTIYQTSGTKEQNNGLAMCKQNNALQNKR